MIRNEAAHRMNRLAEKNLVITGAAAGIGAVTAKIAASEGATVLLADIDERGAAHQAETIRSEGGSAISCRLDLGDEASIQNMINLAVERFGGLDGVFNNAADTSLTETDHGIETMDTALWDKTMEINLRGTMLSCKYAIPALRARGGGAIVNVASGSALRGTVNLSAYAVSKAGVVTLSQYVAAQHGKEGIRCNSIAPGLIMTPKTVSTFPPVLKDLAMRHTLARRLGAPADIAWTFVWLASDEGAYVNGQCLAVDGGVLSHQRYWVDLPETERNPEMIQEN